ncbi:MAG: tripartite tricarboxylate transporter permease [Pseudomonadota bacterium]
MEFLGSFSGAFTSFNLLIALAGVTLGLVIGALPGLSATLAVAVLVPFTFTMAPASGLIALGAVYMGAIAGGSFSAILINTPGTPSSIATTFDGYPMAQRGDGGLAITLAVLASTIGGVVGVVALWGLAPPLADVALAFGPPEYFWLAVLGLTLISALSAGNTLKGLIGAAIGLLLSTVGVAVVGGDVRYTLDTQVLLGGIDITSALIGFYCVPVVLDLVATRAPHLKLPGNGGYRIAHAVRIMLAGKLNLLRSSAIGTLVGILPGAGGSIAGLIAYAEARRASKYPERFGKGEPDGLIATETSNNATVGGGFIPTLVLGIPGTPPDAIILGALLVQGIRTGPSLFDPQGDGAIYTFMAGLMIAALLVLPVGLLIGRYAYRAILSIPKPLLVPSLAFLTIIGSFAIHSDPSDTQMMLALGVAAWLLQKAGFSPSPIVLGLVLGQIAEQGFVQAYLIGSAQNDLPGMFFGRPISLVILAVVVLTLAYPLVVKWFKSRQAGRLSEIGEILAHEGQPEQKPFRDTPAIVFGGLFAILGILAWLEARDMSAMGSVFPTTLSLVWVSLSLALVARQAFKPKAPRATPDGSERPSTPRRVLLVAVMTAWAVLMPVLGFFVSSLAAFLSITAIASFERMSPRTLVVNLVSGIVIVGAFYMLMSQALGLRMPEGIGF